MAREAGQPLTIRVLGLVSIASDVTPELARAAIASVSVLGALQASPAVKTALADRMRSLPPTRPPDCQPSRDMAWASSGPCPRRDAKGPYSMSYINDITAPEMIEATRLTREGRLAEATALLQRLLRKQGRAKHGGLRIVRYRGRALCRTFVASPGRISV